MKFHNILLSFGLASWSLFILNQLLSAQNNVEKSGGPQLFTIYMCGIAETTQYTVYNNTTQTASLVNEYYQPNGTVIGIAFNSIPPNGTFSYTVGDYVPGGFTGDAIISSDTFLTATFDAAPGAFLTAEFTAEPTYGPSPLDVVFTNQAVGYDTVLWDFGDGVTSTLPSPIHTYNAADIYLATLMTDKTGCLDHVPFANPTYATEIIVTMPSADLAVSQTAVPDPVTTGESLTYTLTITNNGPDSASDLVITNTLPTGVTFQSASDGCILADSILTCQLDLLGSSTAVPLTMTVLAPEIAGTITNTITLSAATDDPDMSNNTAVLTTTVVMPNFPIYLPVVIKP